MLLATQTVQVTSEANARPIMTAFTMISACRNMPHGDRSCGSAATPTDGSLGGGAAAAPLLELVSELGAVAFVGGAACAAGGTAGADEAPFEIGGVLS